jgi:aerobic carbon-monoxide dehydrogenase large subunit
MSFFTEAVGAGPRKDMDILGLGMADGCELRVHPTGKAVVRLSVQTQGQGHETTFAQIVAEELVSCAGNYLNNCKLVGWREGAGR